MICDAAQTYSILQCCLTGICVKESFEYLIFARLTSSTMSWGPKVTLHFLVIGFAGGIV